MSVVNLNQARKAQAKNLAKSEAAANRVKFGQTKAEKGIVKALAMKAARLLDGVKRTD